MDETAVLDLAHHAWTSAKIGDFTAARDAVQSIHDDHRGIGLAVLAWLDWCIASRPEIGLAAGVAFRDMDTGEIHFAQDTHPAVVWSGRLLIARAHGDREQFNAVVNTAPLDDEFGKWVWVLLTSCVVTATLPVQMAPLDAIPGGAG